MGHMGDTGILSQVGLANLCGVSKQVVNAAIRKKKIAINAKRKVILYDPLTQKWIEGQGCRLALEEEVATTAPESTEAISLAKIKVQEEIKKIRSDIRLKDLKFEQQRSVLIEKEPTATAVFLYLDALNISMLDLPEMVVDVVIDKIKAGAGRGDIIKIMRGMIKTEIENTKKHVIERLK